MTVQIRPPSVGGGRGLHALECGRSHLPVGHAVDGVVDEYDGYVLAAVGRMDGFGGAYCGQIAVALIGEPSRSGLRRLAAVATAGARP